MSGHSKWANIRVRKTAADAKRGKVFTRHARLIEMAARSGGGDPIMNTTLRTAIENARAENVPNANIDRAIKKGTGALQGEAMAEVLYAAFGPGGIACLIECLTDNRNRTLSNIKMIINKKGGIFAETSAVAWMFERRGVVVAQGKLSSELELQLIDVGAEDIRLEADIMTIMTGQSDWTKVLDLLKGKGFEILESGLKYVAKEQAEIREAETAQKITVFVEALEEDEDVVEVHAKSSTSQFPIP